jgi:hypothetical protein
MAKNKKIAIEVPYQAPKGMLEKLHITDSSELASRITRDFNDSEAMKYYWIPQRAEDAKNYYGTAVASEWPFKGASRVKSQFQRIVVDTLSGNLLKSLFGPEKPLRVNPAPLAQGSSDDTLDNLDYVEDLHNSMVHKEYNLRTVLDVAIPTSLIESFCVLHPVYEYLTEQLLLDVKRWIPGDIDPNGLTYDVDTDSILDGQGQAVQSVNLETSPMTPEELKRGGMKEVEFEIDKEACVKDGISIKVINGYRFYMPIGTPGETPYEKVQNANYAIHQLFYTLGECKHRQEDGYFENVETVTASVYDRMREQITYLKVQEAGFLLDPARLEQEYVEVVKWCGKWKIDGKYQNLIVWMDRGSTQILRVEKNVLGIKPYFPLVPFPVNETPFGESLCQIIRPLVRELDLLMRTITNIALMKSAPPKFFDPASGFNPSTVGNFGPNSWIPAREPAKNVFQPQSPEDPSVAMQMMQFLINILERITGVNEVVQGQISDRANTTATEVQSALTRSGVRFDNIYERYKTQLKPMFKYIHKLTLRHMPDTKEMLLMGEENRGRLVKIHKSQLQGAFEFDLIGNSVVTEQAELQKALMLNQTVGNHPYITYKPEGIYYLLHNIVRLLNPVAVSKILPKPDEVAKIERETQKAQRQQEDKAMQLEQQKQQAAGQMAQQQAQLVQQQAQMQQQMHEADLHAKLQDMQMKEMEFKQKLTHNEQEHQQKLEQMRRIADEKAKQAAKKSESKSE